jgi:hypothetical protein
MSRMGVWQSWRISVAKYLSVAVTADERCKEGMGIKKWGMSVAEQGICRQGRNLVWQGRG